MSVHKKIMQARVSLQQSKLTKSGNNKFAGYKYFELGDFLPAAQLRGHAGCTRTPLQRARPANDR